MGQQNGVEDGPTVAADIVTVGVGSFTDQAMSAKHTKFSANGGRPLALLCLGLGGPGVEQGLQIAVAKAIDLELAAMDGLQ